MPKKIYDIKPPKVAHKVEKDLKEFLAENKKTKKQNVRHKKEGRSIRWPVSIGILIIVLVVIVYLFFKLPKADIVIWPKVEALSFQQTIMADKSAGAIDATKAVIPALYFEASKTETQDFPATGNASSGGQASGTITVYNKFDPPTPFTLKTGTHFMSDSGKLFVALQKIVIPAAQKSGSTITPGSVRVQVQAADGGDSYNIAPSNFSVPGLKGTAYYYSIYAVSTSAMTGGAAGKVKKVTDDDISGANDVLTKKTTDDAVSALKSQISSDYILLDNAISTNVTNASTKTKSGTVADNFTYQVTVKASCLAFKKADLDQFAENYIASQMPEGDTLLNNSFKINYSASAVDVSGGKATLNLNFSSGVYQNIDKNSLSLSMLGENASQINQTLNNSLQDQMSKVQINFWPFWVTKAPDNQNRINVELKFQ
ncbi:MAG: hypothetical protein ABSF55_03375 [Candidatus Staskawiczbacteria bacterium]